MAQKYLDWKEQEAAIAALPRTSMRKEKTIMAQRKKQQDNGWEYEIAIDGEVLDKLVADAKSGVISMTELIEQVATQGQVLRKTR